MKIPLHKNLLSYIEENFALNLQQIRDTAEYLKTRRKKAYQQMKMVDF